MKLSKFEYILFDLDGTITDPFKGITDSVIYSLEKFGISVSDPNTLKGFIGPPLVDSYEKYFAFSRSDAEKAVAYYREYYPVKGILECTLYDGIGELLSELSKNHKLVLATSKPQPFAERILEHFDLKRYFYHVVGATFDSSVSEKSDVIRKVLTDLSITPDKAVMIGDRYYDTDGAAKNGVSSIGVTYGYGEREEFGAALTIADTVDDLFSFFEIKRG